MATHSSILAWRIPWTEEPGRLRSMGSQRVEHDWATAQAGQGPLCFLLKFHWEPSRAGRPVCASQKGKPLKWHLSDLAKVEGKAGRTHVGTQGSQASNPLVFLPSQCWVQGGGEHAQRLWALPLWGPRGASVPCGTLSVPLEVAPLASWSRVSWGSVPVLPGDRACEGTAASAPRPRPQPGSVLSWEELGARPQSRSSVMSADPAGWARAASSWGAGDKRVKCFTHVLGLCDSLRVRTAFSAAAPKAVRALAVRCPKYSCDSVCMNTCCSTASTVTQSSTSVFTTALRGQVGAGGRFIPALEMRKPGQFKLAAKRDGPGASPRSRGGLPEGSPTPGTSWPQGLGPCAASADDTVPPGAPGSLGARVSAPETVPATSYMHTSHLLSE